MRPRWHAVGLSGLFSLLTACSGGVGAGEAQPTVLESPPAKESPSEAAVEEQAEEDSGDSPDAREREADDAEPIPASSDGPAENWPEPDIPEEIYEPTEEGAEALIQYWFEARHHARITGEVEVLEYVSKEECQLCKAEISRVTEAYPTGWFVEDAAHRVHESYVREENDGVVSGLFRLEQGGFDVYWDGDLHREQQETSDDVFGLDFRFEEQRWQVFAFSFIGDADEESVRDIREGED